jgi:aldehyde dehydrogenase (NAD+)
MRNSHKENIKPITLELGGKSANIICADADLEHAVAQACIVFGNCGQSCIAGSRTYVHESIYDKFIEGCVNWVSNNILVGHPLDEKTTQGAIVSKEQFERVLFYINEGVKEGAKVAIGGARWG